MNTAHPDEPPTADTLTALELLTELTPLEALELLTTSEPALTEETALAALTAARGLLGHPTTLGIGAGAWDETTAGRYVLAGLTVDQAATRAEQKATARLRTTFATFARHAATTPDATDDQATATVTVLSTGPAYATGGPVDGRLAARTTIPAATRAAAGHLAGHLAEVRTLVLVPYTIDLGDQQNRTGWLNAAHIATVEVDVTVAAQYDGRTLAGTVRLHARTHAAGTAYVLPIEVHFDEQRPGPAIAENLEAATRRARHALDELLRP